MTDLLEIYATKKKNRILSAVNKARGTQLLKTKHGKFCKK